MISYSGQIRTGRAPDWYDSLAMNDALIAVRREFGDTTHTSGRLDYLVQELINQERSEITEDVANHVFLIVVNEGGLDVIEKVGAALADTVLHCDPTDDWRSRVVESFRDFRRRIAELAL